MVNEINKPPSSENIMLGERLAASNRQLQEMQEEHRQLLQEMQMLRQRAAELSRLNAQEFDDDTNNATNRAAEHPTTQANPTANNLSTATLDSQAECPSSTDSASALGTPTAVTHPSEENKDDDDEDPEAAAYLQGKLAELATLKAQFSRVKTMVNTTDLIERHLLDRSGGADNNPLAVNRDPSANNTNTTASNAPSSSSSAANNPNAGAHSENEELLSTMMNMFTGFTSDLRNQAEELRAERDRIRALKEDRMQARMGK